MNVVCEVCDTAFTTYEVKARDRRILDVEEEVFESVFHVNCPTCRQVQPVRIVSNE